MEEILLFLFFGIPVIIACFGGCRLVSKYTGMGTLEPVIAVVLSIPLMVIGSYQLFGKGDTSVAQMFRETIQSFFDFENLNAYTVVSMLIVLMGITGIFCIAILILVFTFFGICAIFSKSSTGTLVKVEKPEGKQAKFAFYRVDGKVYQCAVAGVSKKLVIGSEYKVRLNKLQNKVYDKATIPTCIAGLFMFLLMVSMFILVVVML